MSSEEWLDQVGQEYLAQVEAEEPQFLIEIDVPDARLKDIFANIGRARPHHWSPQKRICLALAAVHSAAQADESEDSFREMFYKRLGRHFNLTEWDSEYGPVISEFLGAWFSVDVPTSGPYRYVGTVYRHAGIPVPARSGFCLLVVGLLQDGLKLRGLQKVDWLFVFSCAAHNLVRLPRLIAQQQPARLREQCA
jgi:hypothetical protein